jgi:hypothetical protein
MKGEDMRRRRLWVVVLFLAVGISLATCGVAKGAALSGYVYAGEMSRDDTPLAGVTVELYCSNDANSLGTLTASTKTGAAGWYSLSVSGSCEFYNIVQKDLPGSMSVGATSVGGRVVGKNRIQYESPLERKVLTGNNFWDNVPEKDLCDLIIADIWFGQGNVCYMIRNIGRAAAPKGHLTKLSIDGQEEAGDLITVPLAVGEGLRRCFNYPWQCPPAGAMLEVCADSTNTVAEGNETNNCKTKQCRSDVAAPLIMSGPTVSNVTHESAVVSWDTDENSDSVVGYGKVASSLDSQVSDANRVRDHALTLSGLQASTVYQFVACSTDTSGNSVHSDKQSFRTLALPDGQGPQVVLHCPPACAGMTKITTTASDNTGVQKVVFQVNGQVIATDYSEPYECALDTTKYPNADHTVKAVAYDLAGNSGEDQAVTAVKNPLPDMLSPVTWIISPQDGQTVSRQVVVSVHAHDENPNWQGSVPVKRVTFYIDGVYKWTEFGRVQQQFTFNYDWNTLNVPIGQHTIKAVAYDEAGNSAEDSATVTVDRGEPVEIRPYLEVTRLELSRNGTSYRTGLRVENVGLITASEIQVMDHLIGFQARYSGDSDVHIEYEPATRDCSVRNSSRFSLGAGQFREIWYRFVPILTQDGVSYEVGLLTELQYEGPNGQHYDQELSIPEQDDLEVDEAIGSASYLIVTNPQRLFDHYNDPNTNTLLATTAGLTAVRSGVLGYMDDHDAKELLNLVKPGGDWAGQLFGGWEDGGGVVLLVGESKIVPARKAGEVRASDNWYADFTGGDCRPEMVVGRIIGNDAESLIIPIETSLSYGYDCLEGLVVSGIGSGEDSFQDNAEDVAEILDDVCSDVHLIHWGDYASDGDRLHQFEVRLPGRDVIYYRDHGSPTGWSSAVDTGDMPFDLGDAHPFVFACACLTGSYDDHPVYGGGNDSMAEAFLENGAGVYIGATETSPRLVNNDAGKEYFNYWTQHHVSTGTALRYVKKELIDEGGDYKRRWVQEYNLYGDPKYGVSVEAEAALSGESVEADGSEPASSVSFTVPDYNVTSIDGYDHVTIPGGKLLVVAGQPIVPFYMASLEYPKGYKVQNVALMDRSGMTTATGLNLPTEHMQTGENIGQQPLLQSDWYPEDAFTWATFDNPNGSTTLVIRAHPFIYNSLTTDVKFYKNFSFNIVYTKSDVEITAVTTNKQTYRQGDRVRFSVDVNNAGAAMDVVGEVIIRPYGQDGTTAGLFLRLLDDLTGLASFDCVWDSNGTEPGEYCAEVTLKDTSENVLDRRTEVFALGISHGEVTNLAVTPQYVRPGRPVDIGLTFTNTGSIELEGSAVVRIQDANEKEVGESVHSFGDLSPAGAVSFNDSWSAPGSGPYKIIGYVCYDGQATAPKVVEISQCAGCIMAADLNGDCHVNQTDYAVLASHWLERAIGDEDCVRCDIDQSGRVDYGDLAMFAERWLWCNDPMDSGCRADCQ